MYSRSSLRPQQQQQPAIPRGSAMTANMPSWGYPNHYEGTRSVAHEGIRTSNTMPLSMEESDPTEIRQSYSGNLMFRRNRSSEQEQSRSRAEDLCKRLEMSGDRDLDLHKAPSFDREVKNAPSLGGSMMSVQQASALIAQNKQKSLARAEHDPLLTDRERLASAVSSLRLEATQTTSPTIDVDHPTLQVPSFQPEVKANRSFEENVVVPNAHYVDSFAHHKTKNHPVDYSVPIPMKERTLSSSNERVPLGDSNVSYPTYTGPPKKMTHAEKRAELARQTRKRLAAKKGKIPELC